MLIIIAVVMNLIIAAAYGAIGIWIAPKFQLGALSWGTRIARAAGLLFFVTCAFTHVEISIHALEAMNTPGQQVPVWLTTWHGLVLHTVQAIAGWVFVFMAARYLAVRIYSAAYYENEMGRHLAELEEYREAIVHEIEKYT